MPRKSYKPEEIVAKLRQVDVLTSQGQGVAEAIRSIGVSELTSPLWTALPLQEWDKVAVPFVAMGAKTEQHAA
jgi:hypothetical protein